MMTKIGFTAVAASLVAAAHAQTALDPHWPGFRGPDAQGHVADANTVTDWDVQTGKNIRWNTPIPGLAHSSPVIAGDRIFVTTAVKLFGEPELEVGLYGNIEPVSDEGPHEFRVIALDRTNGDVLWNELAIEAIPKIKRHTKGSHAASSPATDGKHVVALFASEGLYCYTVDGEHKWTRDLGVLDSGYFMVKTAQWGFSSSPIIHDDRVIVQVDIQEGSYVAALDLDTGEDIWRTPREEVPGWGTPTVVERDGRKMIVCNGWKEIAAYDYETGERIWKTQGGGDIPVPTPVVAGDHVYITNAHGRMAPILAINLDARGTFRLNEDTEQIAWMHDRRGNYMQTPLVIGDTLFMCSDAGAFRSYNRLTGEQITQGRLGSGATGFTPSPVAAGNKIYFTSEEGEVFVVDAASESLEILAVNNLGTQCMATPAIADNTIYWRTRNSLIAIGRD